MVKIEVPATSANLGSGFDSLGLALTLYNRVQMEEHDKLEISSSDGKEVPKDQSNMVYFAAKHLYDECGVPLRGLRIIQESPIPMTKGLGSSSACIVAGLMGANQLLKSAFNRNDLINIAAKIEGHPDNIAPAILGGLVTSVMEDGKVYSVSVPISRSIKFCAFIPSFELKTEHARSILPKNITLNDATYNLSRSALMTASLFSGSFENLKVAVQDRLHQQHRLPLIPSGSNIFEIAYNEGAFGVYISGSGPTIMAIISANDFDFEQRALTMLTRKGIYDYTPIILNSDHIGASVTA